MWRRAQPHWDSRQLVFIDETGLNTKMTRLYGRCAKSQRCVGVVPHGHWQTSSFIAALRVESIAAPFLIEGSINAEVFTAYLEKVLCPELRKEDIVILDNLATHKIAAVSTLISQCGASVRYLPPYSPDLNPIEMAFAKLKAHLRKTAARTLADLQLALAHSLSTFSPHHCSAFFRHAKYASM